MNREARRAAAKAQRRQHTKRPRRQCDQLGPVGIAAMEATVAERIAKLKRRAGLVTWLGEDAEDLLNSLGHLVFITVAAIGRGRGNPANSDVAIVMGMAESLGDIQAQPWRLESLRPSLQVGMLALQRAMEGIPPFELTIGSVQLDRLLESGRGMGTEDLRNALKGATA